MNKPDREILRAKALAARPGTFSVERRDVDCGYMTFIAHGNVGDYAWCSEDLDPKARRNAEFIAAANRDVVLELLQQVDELEQQHLAFCEILSEIVEAGEDTPPLRRWAAGARGVLESVGYGKDLE